MLSFRRREKLRFMTDGVYGICNGHGIWFGWRLGGYFIESIMIESKSNLKKATMRLLAVNPRIQ